ncbi:MAG: dihydrofolate reductase [Candidatus Doudnabacteria bacterium]|nr:dihydrofolate reductase [Candidatus Doudnabacteria bacterium]
MRKIIVFNMVTVDGFFAGVNGDISWHNVDAEFNNFAIETFKSYGTLVFGRITYDLMAGYWPSLEAPKQNPKAVADNMNNLPKIVFSRTMAKADWNNTTLLHKINAGEIIKMKQELGKDIVILGSGQIVQEFAKLGLVDEYRFMINPVVLGRGKSLFKQHQKLKLIKSREFNNGNVLVYYQPAK